MPQFEQLEVDRFYFASCPIVDDGCVDVGVVSVGVVSIANNSWYGYFGSVFTTAGLLK